MSRAPATSAIFAIIVRCDCCAYAGAKSVVIDAATTQIQAGLYLDMQGTPQSFAK
jgi:hypothetical protein